MTWGTLENDSTFSGTCCHPNAVALHPFGQWPALRFLLLDPPFSRSCAPRNGVPDQPVVLSMRKLLTVLALLLWTLMHSAFAECLPPLREPSAEQLQAARQQARDRGFLWRISKGGHTSYLYGTIHLARLDWIFPGAQVLGALRLTDTVALELNLLDQDTVSAIQKGVRDASPAPQPPAFTHWVRQKAEENCLNLQQLQALRPEVQLMSITMAVARKSGLEASYGIDMLLARIAKDLGRPIEPLEYAQDQLNALQQEVSQDGGVADDLQSFSPEEQEQSDQVLLKLAAAWEHSDFATMESYAQWCHCMETASDRQQMKRLIEDRNPRMANRIDALHGLGHKVFAAVGSLHLIGGDQAVPGLLEKRGYSVQRVF